MQQVRLPWVIVALALIGVAISGYLAWYDLVSSTTYCTLSGFFGCSKILSSPYAHIDRMPTAFLGVVWFAVSAWLGMIIARNENRLGYLLVWSVPAMLGVVILAYIELVVVGAICPLCTSAHVLGIAIFILTLVMWRGRS